VSIDAPNLTGDLSTTTGALRQTATDVPATTGVRHKMMIDVLLLISKINTQLASVTDACLMIVVSLAMIVVHYQKMFALETRHP